MRPFRIPQRRAVAKSNQGEELIQLRLSVDGQRAAAQVFQRERLLRDDRSEKNAHAGSVNVNVSE